MHVPSRDSFKQWTKLEVQKFIAPVDAGEFWVPEMGGGTLDEITTQEGNLLMYGGASCQWETLIGNGTNTGSGNLQYFNAANTYIGVGDSSTAEAATQTNLQATTNKLRNLVSAVTHTDGVIVGSASCVFVATFATTDANFAWNEWGIFNNTSAGRMLNRKVASLGTKTSAAAWVATATLTLA